MSIIEKIPEGLLPSRSELKKIHEKIDIGHPNSTSFRAPERQDAGSWRKTVDIVREAVTAN